MGITGLLPFVEDATDNIHISKYSGQTIAVDTYCWIHRGAFACADKLAKGEKTDMYVNYCKKYVKLLVSFNVKPILVFDGCRLPSKQRVEDERAERRRVNLATGRQLLREGQTSLARTYFTKCVSVTSEMALEVMTMAREMGIDCIVAPYEADSQLAYFSKHDIVQAIITEDSDLLCFGCKQVIFKLDLNGRGREVVLANLGRVKHLVGFTPDLFRHMCILSGCDYLPSIKGVGLTKACKALKLSKSKDSYQVARKLHQYIKGLAPVDPSYGAEFEKADQTFLYQLVFDPRDRKLIPLNEYPSNLNASDLEFAGHVKSDLEAFQISIGNINVNNLKKIAHFNVDQWLLTLRPDKQSKSIWKTDKLNLISNSLSQNEEFVEKPIPQKLNKTSKKTHLLPRHLKKSSETKTSYSPEEVLKALVEKNTSCNEETKTVNKPENAVKLQNSGSDDELLNSYTKKKKEKPERVTLKSRFFSKKQLQKPILLPIPDNKEEQIKSLKDKKLDEILVEIDDLIKEETESSSKHSRNRSFSENPFAKKHQLKRKVGETPSLFTPKKKKSLPDSPDQFNCSLSPISDHKNRLIESPILKKETQSHDEITDLFDKEDDKEIDFDNVSDTDDKLKDDSNTSLHSDEGIAILDNISSPKPLQNIDLNIKNQQKPDDIICISDEEPKPIKKTLGLSRTVSRKQSTGKSSKYFCKAKASGLKGKQPSILNFFNKPKT